MKIIITGHTSGIGQRLFNHLKKTHEVIGFSKSSGYDLSSDINEIVAAADGCDVFINNAGTGRYQNELLERLYNRVGKMIVMGSIAGDYHQLIQSDYSQNKMDLAARCKELSLQPGNQIVHMKISMLEDAVSSDKLIPFQEVIDFVDYWLEHPRLTNVDFEFKLTEFTLEMIKEKFNASQEAIDYVINNMCEDSRKRFND